MRGGGDPEKYYKKCDARSVEKPKDGKEREGRASLFFSFLLILNFYSINSVICCNNLRCVLLVAKLDTLGFNSHSKKRCVEKGKHDHALKLI